MSSFHQVTIGGYPGGGLTTDKKPLMLSNEAYSNLQNAYVFRDRTKKRDGTVTMGQLSRVFTNINFFLTGAANWTFNILTISGYTLTANNANPGKVTTTYPHGLSTGDKVIFTGISGATGYNNTTFTITVVDNLNFTVGADATGFGTYTVGTQGSFISNRSLSAMEPNAQIVPGSFTITFSAATYLDDAAGNIRNSLNVIVGTINYATGAVTLSNTGSGGVATTITYNYYPELQSMGICKRDIATVGIDQTIFFDTKYAYQFTGGSFQELAPGTTWSAPNQANGTNTNFFWSCNYQGATPDLKYFFVTNNNIGGSSFDPIRYYNSSAWNDLTPLVTSTDSLFQALIVVPYYGRLLALNTWEGVTSSGSASATNFFARCRFSQVGNPIAADSWRSDMFGLGGYLDAPTNESIVSVAFFRNTLIVFFEYSTWQLRYIGEYGLPFIFERISSDFGSVCTFSSIVFDQGVMAVSDRAIIQAGANGITRLDEQIPETIFSFEIQDMAPNFVHGVRDFEKELVYWNYVDTSSQQPFQNFPTTTLLFNYRNNTWAQFRDSITCFGTCQFQFGITWDSFTTFWDSNVSWDNVDDQQYVEYVTCGNQQGFISVYENPDAATNIGAATMYGPSLSISAINLAVSPATFTITNHNLANGEIIFITNTLWSGTAPLINNVIFNVTVVDANTVTLGRWNGTGYTAFFSSASGTYIGGGQVALFPVMNIVGKDFNPFQAQGKQFKLSYIDFQMDSNNNYPGLTAVSVQLFVNSYLGAQANIGISKNQTISYVNNTSQNNGIIENALQTNPCTVTSEDHSLVTGDQVYISNVLGMTEINSSISGTSYIITVVNADNFTLNGVDATGYNPYESGGIWHTIPVNGQVYIPGTQYAWYRFYSTQFGQYLRIALTYDAALMNQLSTHQNPMELNAMNIWFREGGRIIN
jgi:Ubiquitin-activating enzyme E1 FCCH domain